MRDEAAVLPRCIVSLKEFQDRGGEIVIVDTGSKDSSVSIGRSLGCKVYEVGDKFQYPIDKELADKINERFVADDEANIVKAGDKYFDFAAARNHCASLATNDWVCWVDCDEVFTKLDIDEIEKVISDEKVSHCEYQFVFSHDYQGKPAIAFKQSKFYNKKKIKWSGIVHEIISPIGEGGEVRYIPESIFLLEHFQQPHERHSYLKGLAVDAYYNPANDRSAHYFARECMYNGRYKSAIKEFSRHILMNGWIAEKAQSQIHIGDCYGFLNQAEEQIAAYSKAFMIDSSRREALIKIALLYKHNNNFQGALSYAKAALEIPLVEFYANSLSDYRNTPHSILYWAAGWSGNIEMAKEHLLKCLEYEPYNNQYLHDTRYYFEYHENFIEGWMKFDEIQFLYNESKKHDVIVEVGSWCGRSISAIASGCKNGKVYAVDTFEGSVDVRDSTNYLAKQMDVYKIFKENTKQFNNITVIRKTSVEAAKDFEDGSISLLFLDAGHDFDSVVADIKSWRKKVKSGGILCGHDWMEGTWQSVISAVRQELGEPHEIYNTIWVFYVK